VTTNTNRESVRVRVAKKSDEAGEGGGGVEHAWYPSMKGKVATQLDVGWAHGDCQGKKYEKFEETVSRKCITDQLPKEEER